MRQYYVYILTNTKRGVLYTGVTNDLARRIWEHKNKIVLGFTEKYQLTKLVYYEVVEDVLSAISREKQLKRWRRRWKFELIEKENPDWNDLAASI